jgi:hypothetical protein
MPDPPSGGSAEGPPPPGPQPQDQAPPFGAFGSEAIAVVGEPAGPPSPAYPASVEIAYPSELNRWLPLIKWFLAIPHYIALAFVGIGAFFVLVYAFFAVLFTRRWPRGAFEYLVGTLRWGYRVIAYIHLMTDAYPPFSLGDDLDYPVRLNIDYPGEVDRWRPLVQWLLAIPYVWIAGLLYALTGLLTVVAFFTVLFTKQIPRGVFELMVPGLRWNLRGTAYSYFMVDRYPPFIWG